MTWDDMVEEVDAEAKRISREDADQNAILICYNIGDSGSPILLYTGFDIQATQYQAATFNAAVDWAMDGMLGVYVVMGVYVHPDEWVVEIEYYKNDRVWV